MEKDNMTMANLRSAFGGESMAYMRYTHWGCDAGKEGFPNVENLFKAIANAEQIHALNHFNVHKDLHGDQLVPAMAGFGIGKTVDNLQSAIDGELYEVEEMYASYLIVAKEQNEKGAYRSFNWAWEVEKIHADLFQKAKNYVEKGEDFPADEIYVCQQCGYTIENGAPDTCPICKVKKEKFKGFARD